MEEQNTKLHVREFTLHEGRTKATGKQHYFTADGRYEIAESKLFVGDWYAYVHLPSGETKATTVSAKSLRSAVAELNAWLEDNPKFKG